MAMTTPKQTREYKRARYFGSDSTINELAAEGWTVVPGTVASYDGYWYVLMEREV